MWVLYADAVVAAAFERAKKSHKPVMLDLGGNWCPDCIILANVMQLPAMKKFMKDHYEFASVDVGRFDKNLQVPAKFGYKERLKGVPTVLVATPDGKLAYIANAGSNSVSVLNVAERKEIAKIPVGEVPKRNATAVMR